LPAFLAPNNLKPFISQEILDSKNPILFKPIKGAYKGKAFGYNAELLPKVCYVYVDAQKANALLTSQKNMAFAAEAIIRGLATVGIIALVDEATGYQEIRDRNALQKILDKYLLKEYASWAKRFPDEFYKEMFRLKNWQWNGMSVKRPSVDQLWLTYLVRCIARENPECEIDMLLGSVIDTVRAAEKEDNLLLQTTTK